MGACKFDTVVQIIGNSVRSFIVLLVREESGFMSLRAHGRNCACFCLCSAILIPVFNGIDILVAPLYKLSNGKQEDLNTHLYLSSLASFPSLSRLFWSLNYLVLLVISPVRKHPGYHVLDWPRVLKLPQKAELLLHLTNS